MAKADLTAERLRDLLNYDPETGVFTWKSDQGTNQTQGKVAGWTARGGWIEISIDGASLKAHRLAWLHTYGELPSGRLTHINGNRADNRIANLQFKSINAGKELTHERLKEVLTYDPDTGHFTRNITTCNSLKVDDPVGVLDNSGYIRIGLDLQTYAAHRLAWFYVHGEWPVGEIDHMNGHRADNRLSNLRCVTRQQNVHNRHRTWAASGYMGVSRNHGRWKASINVDGKTISLGNFGTPEEAHEAYLAAKRKLHPTSTL